MFALQGTERYVKDRLENRLLTSPYTLESVSDSYIHEAGFEVVLVARNQSKGKLLQLWL
jgi:hypothetical protein